MKEKMPGFPTYFFGTPTNRGKAQHYSGRPRPEARS